MISTSKKQEKLCWFSLYILADKALLPTRKETDIGDFDVEPVREFDFRDRGALTAALNDAFAVGNPTLAPPPEKQRTPMEIRSKCKSWADLERKSICFSIKCYPSEFSVKSWGRAPDGKWGPEKDLAFDVSIPVEQGMGAVADAILDHLKTRRDLPGLMSQSA